MLYITYLITYVNILVSHQEMLLVRFTTKPNPSEQVSEFAVHYKGDNISHGSSFNSLPGLVTLGKVYLG